LSHLITNQYFKGEITPFKVNIQGPKLHSKGSVGAVVRKRAKTQCKKNDLPKVIYPAKYVLYVIDLLHGERNGNVVGMKYHAVQRVVTPKDVVVILAMNTKRITLFIN